MRPPPQRLGYPPERLAGYLHCTVVFNGDTMIREGEEPEGVFFLIYGEMGIYITDQKNKKDLVQVLNLDETTETAAVSAEATRLELELNKVTLYRDLPQFGPF